MTTHNAILKLVLGQAQGPRPGALLNEVIMAVTETPTTFALFSKDLVETTVELKRR